MNYTEAKKYIEEISGLGIVPGLDSVRELCRRLGDPQDRLKYIHIAGTNGKGSVAAFSTAILSAAGYRVGCYSSPAVFEYRERFKVAGRMISQVAFCSYMEQVKAACDAMVEEELPHPTLFEVETALAFLFFADKQCDIVVLEAGMGGRMDATNVIGNTLVAIITSIGMDHMEFLGNSISQIAAEKAGIIKNRCYVITGKQQKDAERIIRQKVSLERARFVTADPGRCKKVVYGTKKQVFSYEHLKDITIHLSGSFQIDNAVLVIETMRALQKCGFVIKDEHIREGFAQTEWPGRFQVIAAKPMVILDGAHNEGAAERLKESIERCLTEEERQHMILVMGVLQDKEYEKVAALICPYGKHVITVTPPENKRALSAVELARTVQEINPTVTVADSLEEAAEIMYLLADKESVIVAFGSLSYLGRFSDIVQNYKIKRK